MFNYFIPGKTKEQIANGEKLDRDMLRACGIDALTDVVRVPQHTSVLDVKTGPDGGPGVIIAPVRVHLGPPDCFFDSRLQQWDACRGGRYWIGYSRKFLIGPSPAERPAPSELERFEQLGGFEVLDAHSQAWRVPICRAPNQDVEFGCLPQSYTLDADTGEMQSHLQSDYVWLWELSGKIRDWYWSDVEPSEDATPAEKAAHVRPPFGKLVGYAAQLLGVNYRLSPVELNVLHKLGVQLLTQATVHAICQAAFGWEVREQAAKKKPASDLSPLANSSPSTTGAETPPAVPGIALAAEH
jgi:hypothetical protein